MTNSEIKEVLAKSCEEWRDWLQRNNLKENKVYLIRYKKHTGQPTFNNHEAMRVAICFGWIDTTIKRIDDEKYCQCFVKRTKRSRWSNNTLRYARELIKEGKMSSAGFKAYKEGLKKPTIDHNLPKNPNTPTDLKKALGDDLDKFKNFSPSFRRYYIYWIEKAKKIETRKRRIKETVQIVKNK